MMARNTLPSCAWCGQPDHQHAKHRPRWHDWLDTAVIVAILVVDTLWLVLR